MVKHILLIISIMFLFLLLSCDPETNDFEEDPEESDAPVIEGMWEYSGSGTVVLPSFTETILISETNVYEIVNLGSGEQTVTYFVSEYENFEDENNIPGTKANIICNSTTDTGVANIGDTLYNTMILIDKNTMRTYYIDYVVLGIPVPVDNPYPSGNGGEEMAVFDSSGTNYMTYHRID
jgi:hypothetical protein